MNLNIAVVPYVLSADSGKTIGSVAVGLDVAELNPVKILAGIVKVLVTTSRPRPHGAGAFDHSGLAPVLRRLATAGLAEVAASRDELVSYLASLSQVEPDELTRHEALAFWINAYNAGAIDLAIAAFDSDQSSVIHVPGAFSRPTLWVAGKHLSLDAIEHAKVRRFKDPRIHSALVCGSLSCPTLRAAPYEGPDIDRQLEDQMSSFLAGGGAVAGKTPDELSLSRVFLWYGADFVRPQRMPSFVPVSRSKIRDALRKWLPAELVDADRVVFQTYDWSLACSVA